MKSASLVNIVLVAVVSVACGAASFFAFPQAQTGEEGGWTFEGAVVWGEALEATETMTARLNSRDSISLLPGSSAVLTWDETTGHLDVELNSGSVFFSTLAGDFSVSVETPFTRVDSQNSVAYVALSAEQLDVYGLTHPSLVTFLLNGKDLNALLVPTDTKMKISSSKVTQTLARLRLTKLTKEFQVFDFEDTELSEDLASVMASGQQAYSDNELAFLNQVQEDSDFGPAITGIGGVFSDGYDFMRQTLTVLSSAETRLQEREKENALTYAMTNLLYGDATQGQTWLSTWQSSTQNQEEVGQLYRELFFVVPGDELYPLKAAAAEILYPEQDPLTALRRQFQEIESLLESGSNVEAQSAYMDYQEKFESALNSGDFDAPETSDEIGREYVLLELLLRSHSVFYSTDSVKLLTDLEEKILDLSGSDQDLDEERQAFVQSKIRFLDNLFTYVIDRKVSVETATDLAKELLSEAESYLNSISSEVAVRDYFESKLEEFDLSILFMNSPEFYTYDSFEEGLAAYRTKASDLADLNDYIQSLRSSDEEETVSITLEDATKEVETALRSNAIQFSSVTSLGDSSYRLFSIDGARTAGFAFEAKYDRETQILYDVVVEEIRFSTGITLENAKTVIEQAVNDSTATETTDETSDSGDTSDETLAEGVAISLVESALEDATLKPEDFTITVVDLKQNLFTIEGILVDGQVTVSGTFDLDTNLVTEITWEYNGQTETLDDVELSQLEGGVREKI